jgi:IclR family transcriptional regulator, pca regulon regulatory protein
VASDNQPPEKKGREDRRRPQGQPILPEPDPRRSLSLEYGLAMLQCFTADKPRQGIADLTDILGASRATAHRYASTLRELGYLEQDRHRKYRLASAAQNPGAAVIGRLRRELPAVAVLEMLRHQTGYTVSMAALDDTAAIYCHRLHAHRKGQYDAGGDIGIGARLPLHSTAVGKALLAHIPVEQFAYLLSHIRLRRFTTNTVTTKMLLNHAIEQCRLDGIAVSDQEHLLDARSIAVPVTDWHGTPPMAVEVTAPATDCTMQELLARAGPVLRSAAKEISVRQGR